MSEIAFFSEINKKTRIVASNSICMELFLYLCSQNLANPHKKSQKCQYLNKRLVHLRIH